MTEHKDIQRLPAEQRFSDELAQLVDADSGAVPPGWTLSPKAVETFITGDADRGISRKFVAREGVVRRIIVALLSGRGSFMVGPPGTAKSWLSELLAAAVSSDSTLVIQGSSVTEIGQLLYGWDQSRLATMGYHRDALVPGPLYRGMRDGKLVRFEELSRCPQPLQDTLLSILSERVVAVPELGDNDASLYARQGFNVVATANSADQGVNQMSVALKRRLSFETIGPIQHLEDEISVVQSEVALLNRASGIELSVPDELLQALVTLFHELRTGQSMDGKSTHRLAGAALSTAEAINVMHSLSVHAWYFNDGKVEPRDLVHFIIGTALKDRDDDRRRLRYYFDTELGERESPMWRALYEQRDLI
jgi:MoxR-like ATPase